ncbi:hypothetical protein [Kosakonia sacchari]|uniref:hypothetical protein n=1 Tax=Kosakonia sacchari TaxID=1158459 RepID=UPI0020B174CB|nr:hypothetical protein [Kosakonia sacchari]
MIDEKQAIEAAKAYALKKFKNCWDYNFHLAELVEIEGRNIGKLAPTMLLLRMLHSMNYFSRRRFSTMSILKLASAWVLKIIAVSVFKTRGANAPSKHLLTRQPL